MGTFYDQKFYAVKAGGKNVRFPFPPQPFTALIDINTPVSDEILTAYAKALLDHGCVHSVCRGDDAERLNQIFSELAEEGGLDTSGFAFTSMCSDDESLVEALQYFILPSGLASTGLVMIIGDAGDFQNAIEVFSESAGRLLDNYSEPVYVDEELVCFDMV